MIDLRVKGDATKARLIGATETMLAEKCFDAISVRDITGLAKANVAAVNYHFGNREGLLATVLENRIKPLSAARIQRLEALSPSASPRDILAAWAKPLLELSPSEGLGEVAHARVLGRCLEAVASGTFAEASQSHRPAATALHLILTQALPAMQPDQITWRTHFAEGALIHLLVHGASVQGASVQGAFRMESALALWIHAMTDPFPGDEFHDRQPQEPAPPLAKPRATTPLRQVVEVVSAVMEADEPSAEPIIATSEPDRAPEAKPARSKKPKKDEGTGELFLF
jgi:AcrR family transcriptional regulator